jgi:hypothetical protein
MDQEPRTAGPPLGAAPGEAGAEPSKIFDQVWSLVDDARVVRGMVDPEED